MKKLITMREALASDRYFATYLAGDSWSAWRVILLAVMGEELNATERATFRILTGRETEPLEHVREIMAVVGRRGGKSRAASVLGAFIAGCCDHRAVLAPGERGVLPILAASTRQAQQMFNFLAGIFASVPAFKGLVNDSTADTLRLKSGVDVTITTASWRTVRSITSVSAICDELAFWRSDDSLNPDEEIVSALKPALLTTGGMLIGISSPHSKKGVLWNSFRRNFGEGGDPRKLVIQAPSLTLNPTLPKEEINLAYEEDPAKAAAEYGGQFRNDLESYIDRQILDRLVTPDLVERAPVPGIRYQAFVDMSGGSRDSAALAVGHQSGTRFTLDMVRERKAPHSPESVTEEFAGLLRRYGVLTVTGDAYAGRFPSDAYARHGIAYKPSERNRSQIYIDFLPRLNSAEVDLLDVPIVLNQLASLERRTAHGGRDSIDHPPGGRDDCANAVAGVLSTPLWRQPVAQIGHYSIAGYRSGRNSSNPNSLTPAEAVRLGYCSMERAKANGWIR